MHRAREYAWMARNIDEDLIKKSEQISEKWSARLKAKSSSQKGTLKRDDKVERPYDSLNGYLKREVYLMVKLYLLKGNEDQLRNAVIKNLEENNVTFKSSQASQANPFYWGLMSVLARPNKKNKKNPVRRQDLHKFSNELLYAHRHDVPSKFLVGFIYQIGNSDHLSKRLSEGTMEEWYRPKKSAADQTSKSNS